MGLFDGVWMNFLNQQRVVSHLVSQVLSAHALFVFPWASLVSCFACSEKGWRDCNRFRPGVLAVTMLCSACWSSASARRDKARHCLFCGCLEALSRWQLAAWSEISIRSRYFAMILFQTIMVSGERVNLLQFRDTASWFRHTIYHCITCMIYRTRVCMQAVQSCCAWVWIWQTKFRACSHLHQLHTIDKVS